MRRTLSSIRTAERIQTCVVLHSYRLIADYKAWITEIAERDYMKTFCRWRGAPKGLFAMMSPNCRVYIVKDPSTLICDLGYYNVLKGNHEPCLPWISPHHPHLTLTLWHSQGWYFIRCATITRDESDNGRCTQRRIRPVSAFPQNYAYALHAVL